MKEGKTMKNYFSYMRISTKEERALQKYSRQEKALEKYAKENNVPLREWIESKPVFLFSK